MSKLVTIYGGSGFVGRYIARRMARAGWRVRVAVRHPNEAMFVRPFGVVGQVEPVLCNIRDDASVAAAMVGADAVVNCVGTMGLDRKNTFDAVHIDGAARVARLAAAGGVGTMVHISAIGANADSPSEYGRSKAAGEAAVLDHMPNATILRPSVIFGAEDAFFNRFARMATNAPVIPLVGADTKFQPVFVDDVAAAAERALTDTSVSGIYELGGPRVATFRDWMATMLGVIQRRRLVLGLPFFAGHMLGAVFEFGRAVSLGILPAMITRDQVKSLRVDNMPNGDTPGLAELGVTPTAVETELPDYLWRFRPSGQYAAIKASAKNLKT